MSRLKNRNNIEYEKKQADALIVIPVAALTIFGVLMVFSASYYVSISDFGTPYHYLIRDLMWVGIGIIALIVGYLVPYQLWARLGVFAYILGFVLLVMVLTSFGSDAYGATRWIKVGPVTIMPGEMAKAMMIAFITWFYSRYHKRAQDWKTGIIPLLVATGIYILLIMKQPNFSTAATLVLIVGGMMIVAGIKWIQVVILGAAGFGLGVVLMLTSEYRAQRFLSFLDPFEDLLGAGWNAAQSLYALSMGGLFGRGLGNSVEKNLYLPMPQNDFILSVIGEELGFVGILALLAVYTILIWRGFIAAMNASDYTGMMLASGITIMIGVQVIINLAVVTSSMPPTGVVLPFISFGGNAEIIFMGEAGILLNISKQGKG